MIRMILVNVFCFLFFLAFPVAAQGPTDRVQTMLNDVLAIQNDPALQSAGHREERRDGIKKIIGRNFDFNVMARNALGNYWPKLSDPQRKEFIGIFRDLFQDSYTKLVLDFLKREKISYGREVVQKSGAEVDTTIVRSSEKIPVNYFLSQYRGEWLVHDVTIDGVSIVRNYQRSFSRIIQKDSYKSLLDKLRLQQRAVAKSTGPDESPKSGVSPPEPDNQPDHRKETKP